MRCVVLLRCGDEDVLWLDVTVEELAVVDVFQSGHDLKEDAFHAVCIHGLVLAGLHELIQIAIHELHGNVEPTGVRIQEDVQGWYQVRVWW